MPTHWQTSRPSQHGSSNWQAQMSAQAGPSNWQSRMPAQSATPYWQTAFPSHLGTYNLNLQPSIERQHDAAGLLNQKFNFEANSQIILSFKLPSFDYVVDITDDAEARLWNNTGQYYITHLDDTYTCPKTQTYPNHRNANKKVIAHLLTPKLQDRSRVLREKDIQKDILEEYKIHISYQQAWGGKDYGAITRIKTDEKGVVEMLFIAIGASIRTFLNCLRPVLMIDAAHLKGLYKGTNMVAVAMDGNNQIVPIAFGICKGETGADMQKCVYLKSVRDELLRSMEEKRQLMMNYRDM
nr:transposase, MuDR, MULE transposase domain protein [Tanacetum cinerariifolium]